MTSNHKLSALLKGRAIATIAHDGAALSVTFADGSVMTVQTGGNVTGGAAGAVVAAMRQEDTTLLLVFADGTEMQITTAEASSSVIVRDRAHVLEYAD